MSTVRQSITIYRIAPKKYINDKTGVGAKLFGGRWNDEGVPVLYASETESLVILEVLAHSGKHSRLAGMHKIEIRIPVGVPIGKIEINKLKEGWRDYPVSGQCRQKGKKWIEEKRFCVLEVPSAIVVDEKNYLINPFHEEFNKLIFGNSEKLR